MPVPMVGSHYKAKQLGMEARMQQAASLQAPFVFALWLLRCMRYEACSIAILRHIVRVSLLSAYLHIISHRYSLYLLTTQCTL